MSFFGRSSVFGLDYVLLCKIRIRDSIFHRIDWNSLSSNETVIHLLQTNQKLENATLNPIICIGNYYVDKKLKNS